MSARDALDLALLVLGVLIAFGLLLLLGHGLADWLGHRAYDGRTAEARAALIAAVEDGGPGPGTAAALRRLPRERRLQAFAELAPNLAGPDRDALGAVAAQLGILARAQRRCTSRRWRRRVHAVRLLALLGGGEAHVPPLLRDPRPEVRAQAAEWAASAPSPEVVEALVALLGDPQPFTRFTTMDSLIRMGRAPVEALGRAIEGVDGPPAGAPALQVAARIADPRLARPARTRLADRDPEVRAWVARLLGALGGEAHAEAVAALLGDREPEVRAAAAIALGRLGHWPSAGALAAHLRDPAWRVRRDAALALRALGPAGELLLERALRDEDPFARDMARQTLDLPEVSLPA